VDYVEQLLDEQLNPPLPETESTPEEPDGFWQNLRTLKRVENPPRRHARKWQDLDTFRQTVSRRMREYMAETDPEYMLLIPAPPGSGKTWAGVDFAHWVYAQTQHRVLYAGPYKGFYGDILSTVVKQEKDLNLWYNWKPRQSSDDIELHTCKHEEKINEWMAIGYDGMDFCKKVCRFDYINNECPYHQQKYRKIPLCYGHHLHVTLGHPWAKEFAVVIGDELPISAFVRRWEIPGSRLKIPDNVPYESPVAPLLNDLRKIIDMEPTKFVSGIDLLRLLGGPERILSDIGDDSLAFLNFASVIAPHLPRTGDTDNVPANYLPEFLTTLQREAKAAIDGIEYPRRLYVDKDGLVILTRRNVNEQYRSHMIWFDATGTKELYTAMFQRDVEVIDAQPKPKGRIFQVTDRGNGKRSLVRRGKDKKTGEMGDLLEINRVDQIASQINAIIRSKQKPGILTHKAIEEALRKKLGRNTRHFYEARGTNEFEECDIIVVAGTPMPPIPSIVETAKCLWPERMRPFDDEFVTVDKLYDYRGEQGEGYSYPVSQFMDPDLNTVLWQQREGEIIQMAHRSRMLFRRTDVYLLSNIPIGELPPHKLLTIRELFGAPVGVDVFKWNDVLNFARTKSEKQGFVTVSDFVDGLGINKKTALKYIDILVESAEWELAIVPSRGGRPPKAIRYETY